MRTDYAQEAPKMKTQVRPPVSAYAKRIGEFINYSEMKRLTDNVMALQSQKHFHTLAVLSVFPREGKTLFSAALAMAYSGI